MAVRIKIATRRASLLRPSVGQIFKGCFPALAKKNEKTARAIFLVGSHTSNCRRATRSSRVESLDALRCIAGTRSRDHFRWSIAFAASISWYRAVSLGPRPTVDRDEGDDNHIVTASSSARCGAGRIRAICSLICAFFLDEGVGAVATDRLSG